MTAWELDWREFGFLLTGLKRLKVTRRVMELAGIGFLISDPSPWSKSVSGIIMSVVSRCSRLFQKSGGVGVQHGGLQRVQGCHLL